MTTRFDFFKWNFIKRAFTCAALFLLISFNVSAEYFSLEEINFTMDIPEGYAITDMNDTSIFLESKLMPVKFAIKIYPTEVYADSKTALEDAFKQLGTKAEIEDVDWYGRNCYISTFQFVLPDQKLYAGWGLALQVPFKDNPKQKVNMLFLTYADAEISRDCDQYMLSILDSIFFTAEDFRRPGPVTTFAFPESEDDSVILNIGGKRIESKIKHDAIERSTFVLEREYAVLKIYANQKNWKEAWQRYYRMIFKESYNAMDQISKDIYKVLLPQAQLENFKNPNFEILKMLLDWVQDFNYVRDTKNTDFTPITASVQGVGSDCDSRSLLMCTLLEHMGYKTELFISREYSHAVFGVDAKQKGAAINVDGIDYNLGETTAKVDFGLIAQEQRDTEKWIPVDLP